MLTDQHIEFVQAKIDQCWGLSQDLKEDLLDHFCCAIENEMTNGASFDEAYQKAFMDICPNGLEEIQKERFFLLHAKQIITMKKLLYSIGLLASVSISLGWLFKLLHWPGADQLFTYGFLGLVLLFLPLLAIDQFKTMLVTNTANQIKIGLGLVSAFLTGIAVVCKLLHLEGADLLLVAGTLLFAFGFLPFLFFRMYKKSLE